MTTARQRMKRQKELDGLNLKGKLPKCSWCKKEISKAHDELYTIVGRILCHSCFGIVYDECVKAYEYGAKGRCEE